MGLFSNVFGGGEEYAPLDPSDAAAARIAAQRAALQEMAGRVRDRLELVPAEEMVLLFVGQPPDRFRVAWLTDGDEHNFKGLLCEKGITERDLQRISEFLRVAYERHQREPRFTTMLAGRKLTVSPGPLMISIARS
ncbi:MAG: hypothetical protein EHM78_12995 [Myxococcaceae bacterium]|nr:MAG: hypothetical protein EHM78_12995 [Myxococcaceae bacterium]